MCAVFRRTHGPQIAEHAEQPPRAARRWDADSSDRGVQPPCEPCGGYRLPLRVAADPSEVEADASTIFYDVDSGRWRLRAVCFDCSGFELPLTSFGRGAVEAACDEALSCLELIAREGCPHCRTLREREAPRDCDDEPRIWFDTMARDWLMWQPIKGGAGGTMPLGIPRFDTRRAL